MEHRHNKLELLINSIIQPQLDEHLLFDQYMFYSQLCPPSGVNIAYSNKRGGPTVVVGDDSCLQTPLAFISANSKIRLQQLCVYPWRVPLILTHIDQIFKLNQNRSATMLYTQVFFFCFFFFIEKGGSEV